MSHHAVNMSQRFSYADYLDFPEDERWEILEGIPYNMSPAPGTEHQRISGELFGILWSWLKTRQDSRDYVTRGCRVFAAPFDVRLGERMVERKRSLFTLASNGQGTMDDHEIDTVVQPDIVVVCDDEKLDDQGCFGPPDLVVEILSPSTAYKDTTEKLSIYERFGIREYWIVNPKARYMMVYTLKSTGDRKEERQIYSKPQYLNENDTLECQVLPGLKIPLGSIWAGPLSIHGEGVGG